jgi:hypothetical protein
MARDCYDCHSLKGGEVYDNSYAISTTSAVGPDPAAPFRCDFCHLDHANYFDNTYLTGIYQSSHPVQLIEGNQLISKFFNSGTATTIECKACHGGNTVTGSPTDRDPDVAPSAYTVSGDTPTDGYPDHDTENAPDNVVIQGDEPHLTAAYDPTPASTAEVATNYALCFTCHDGGASTTRAKNIQQDYIDKGHFFGRSIGGDYGGRPDSLFRLPLVPRQSECPPVRPGQCHRQEGLWRNTPESHDPVFYGFRQPHERRVTGTVHRVPQRRGGRELFRSRWIRMAASPYRDTHTGP